MPLVVGTSAGAMAVGEEYYRAAIAAPDRRAGQLRRVEIYQVQRQLAEMAAMLDIEGPLRIISNACASGANALGHAFHLVRSGKAERVLAGGYDALCQLVFAGFDSLQALSPTPCRPFEATSMTQATRQPPVEALPTGFRAGAVMPMPPGILLPPSSA